MPSTVQELPFFFFPVHATTHFKSVTFNLEQFCPPGVGRHLAKPEAFLVVMMGEEMLLASSRWRPGMLLNSLQDTGQPQPTQQAII